MAKAQRSALVGGRAAALRLKGGMRAPSEAGSNEWNAPRTDSSDEEMRERALDDAAVAAGYLIEVPVDEREASSPDYSPDPSVDYEADYAAAVEAAHHEAVEGGAIVHGEGEGVNVADGGTGGEQQQGPQGLLVGGDWGAVIALGQLQEGVEGEGGYWVFDEHDGAEWVVIIPELQGMQLGGAAQAGDEPGAPPVVAADAAVGPGPQAAWIEQIGMQPGGEVNGIPWAAAVQGGGAADEVAADVASVLSTVGAHGGNADPERIEPDSMLDAETLAAWEDRPCLALVGAALYMYNMPPSVHDTPNVFSPSGIPRPQHAALSRTRKFLQRETDPERVWPRTRRVSMAQSALCIATRVWGIEAAAEAMAGVLRARGYHPAPPLVAEVRRSEQS